MAISFIIPTLHKYLPFYSIHSFYVEVLSVVNVSSSFFWVKYSSSWIIIIFIKVDLIMIKRSISSIFKLPLIIHIFNIDIYI